MGQVDPPALLGFLAVTPQLRELHLSCGPPLGPILPALAVSGTPHPHPHPQMGAGRRKGH